MTCDEARKYLDAYFDDELDLKSSLAVEDHLAHCEACATSHRQLIALRQEAIAAARYAPSAALVQNLRAGLERREPSVPGRLPLLRSAAGLKIWAAAASVALAVVLFWRVAPWLGAGLTQQRLAREVTAAHVRSLMADHLTDIGSSEQHTVKPWFQGKLDFSFSVRDWASDGFSLVGGRLEYIDDTNAAALVYRSGKHVVNLIIWPARSSGGDGTARKSTERGFTAYSWTETGMNYWLVSDLADAELLRFVHLIQSESRSKM